MLLTLKSKLLALGGALLALLLGLLKFFAFKAKREKKRRIQAEHARDYAEDVVELDAEVAAQSVSRRVQARKEVESGKTPEFLRKPDA